MLGVTGALSLDFHLVDEGRQLPHLECHHFGQRPAEPLGDESGSNYSSPTEGSGVSDVVLILMAPASSHVKAGLVRRLLMKASA